MSRKPIPNTDAWVWSPEHQRSFISDARDYYRYKCGTVHIRHPVWEPDEQRYRYILPRGRLNYQVLNWLYQVGRPFWLKISYEEFLHQIIAGHYATRRHHTISWYERHGVGYREKQKFVKNKSKVKNKFGENSCKSSKQKWKTCKRRGPGNYYKKRAARRHRRWIKHQLSLENWDDLIIENTRRFADPWEWD